ncbi:hypothetical protein, partial [Klebsiella pneumoniae]|uniref:hypothetical protein n=1 Tax=Klebsiella pneumoniae TaxID=573 RepID=UPI003CFC2F3D
METAEICTSVLTLCPDTTLFRSNLSALALREARTQAGWSPASAAEQGQSIRLTSSHYNKHPLGQWYSGRGKD